MYFFYPEFPYIEIKALLLGTSFHISVPTTKINPMEKKKKRIKTLLLQN